MKISLHTFIIIVFSGFFGLDSMATDLYWVGNSGNWHDPSHWATTSGGQGGAGIPGPADDVYFDNNSFTQPNQSVQLNADGYCNTIKWKNQPYSPEFKGSANLFVFGSFYLHRSVKVTLTGEIHFRSTNSGNQIFAARKMLTTDIYFDGKKGGWTLQGPLFNETNNAIHLLKGTLATNNYSIGCGSFLTDGKTKRKLELGTSTVLVQKEWDFAATHKLTLDVKNAFIYVNNNNPNFVKTGNLTYTVHQATGSRSHTVTTSKTDATCRGSCDGTATATVTGGSGCFDYIWDSSPQQTTQTATGLCAGSYIVEVIDNECTASTGDDHSQFAIESISEPPGFAINFSPSSPSVTCDTYCDESITASVLGGTPGYDYLWGPTGQTTQTATGLCAGVHTLSITDVNGCDTSKSITVASPPPVVANVSGTNISCNGFCDGSATTNPSGGSGSGYTYNWSTNETTQSISNLCPGKFYVTVLDSEGCIGIDSVTITEPLSLVFTDSLRNVSCGGACDGEISVTPSGGTTPYSYQWDDPGTQTDSIADGLCGTSAGIPYNVTISDANGCSVTGNYTITEPDTLIANASGYDLLCFAVCEGAVISEPIGGSSPYFYAWSNAATTDSVPNLCPGTYDVTVTDSNGCTDVESVNITEPPLLVVDADSTDVSCNGANDGSATAIVSGGTTPYGYLWDTGANTQSIFSLGPGTYCVTITDGNGCQDSSCTVVNEPPQLTVTMSSTNVSCNGLCDGDATATVTGGTSPYSYLWNVPGTTNSISNLCPGTYGVQVTDANGCVETGSVTITEPGVIDPNLTGYNISCFNACDGAAVSDPIGGTSPFNYSWSSGQSTDSISGLCPGTFTVTVTDDNGCSDLESVTITEPSQINANLSANDPTCNGQCDGDATSSPTGGTGSVLSDYSFSWNNGDTLQTADSLCAGFAIVTVTDPSSCFIVDSIEIVNPAVLDLNDTSTNITCNGLCDGMAEVNPSGGVTPYSYDWSSGGSTNSETGLCPGTVSVTVTDAATCSAISTFNITQPPVITTTTTEVDATCSNLCDGSGEVTASGGTSPYSYQWDLNTGFQTTQIATGLCQGSYDITVTDSLGCFEVNSVNITASISITIDPSEVKFSCNGLCDGEATATATGGATPYDYAWSNGDFDINADSSVTDSLCNQWYYITATDALGCESFDSIFIDTAGAFTAGVTVTDVSCFGGNDGTATAIGAGGSTPYTYEWLSNGATTQTITGLIAGSYTVVIADSNLCLDTATGIITEPALLVANAGKTDILCFGNCDGMVFANPTGGTTGYSFSWSNGCATDTCTSLCAGSYTVTVTDANGCTDTSTVNILEPPILTSTNPSSTNVDCFGACDGSASVNISGGVTPYSYSWTNGCTTPTCSNLCAGTHTVTVTDANGCSLTETFNITEPSPFLANASAVDATCGGVCDGEVSAAPTGGTPPYSYSWSNGCAASNCTGLCAGTYSVTITDFNNCTAIDTVEILEPTVLSITMSDTDVLCSGNCNGDATANTSGGTTPYNYSWNDPDAQTAQTATGLCAGTYGVTVTDFNGCSITGSTTITEPAPLAATTSSNPSNCGNCDGWVSVSSVSGGTPPPSYLWSTGHTSQTVSSLCAAIYYVTITDFNGCSIVETVPLSNIGGPTGAIVAASDASCYGSCDGEGAVSPVGGSSPYTYLWDDPATQTTQTAVGLCADDFLVEITDDSSCVLYVNVSIDEPDSLDANFLIDHASCNGICDGSASANPSGGTAPYTYQWSTGQTGPSIANLCAGVYTLTLGDANNCSKLFNVTINEPGAITVTSSSSDASCSGICDGSATASHTGGSAPFTYLWSDGQIGQTASGLCAGSYAVTVTDANGCSSSDNTAVVGEPAAITANEAVTNATCGACNGSISVSPSGGGSTFYNYTWSGGLPSNATVNNLCSGVYDLTITDGTGCEEYFSFAVSDSSGPETNTSVVNLSCNGTCDGEASVSIVSGASPFTYSWSPGGETTSAIIGLCTGTYYVEVTDNLGCSTIDTAVVNQPAPVTASISKTNVTCNSACDGSAMANPSGGTVPYSYQWSHGPTTQFVSGLCMGTYEVTITAANGCAGTETVTINQSPTLLANATGTDASCNGNCDGTASSLPTGGTPPYSYSWSNGVNSQSIGALCVGSYTVTVTDANGCTNSETVAINEPNAIASTATINDADCGNCNGVIDLSASGGTAPYTYQWSPGGQTSEDISGLCAGNYDVEITDVNGCSQSFSYIVNNINGPDVTATGTNVTCFGDCNGSASSSVTGGATPYDYLWTPGLQTTSSISNLCAGTYELYVTDNSGCIGIDTVEITEPFPIASNLSSTDESCPGDCDGTATANPSGGSSTIYSYQWSNLQNSNPATALCAGNYALTISDASGCTATDVAIINSPVPMTVTVSSSDENCSGSCDGTASVGVSGGSMPYSYLWSNGSTAQAITNLCPASYDITITDASGCSVIETAIINGPSPLAVNATGTDIGCNGECNGTVTANVSGGTTPYVYNWSPAGQITQTASGLCAGTYTVTVTDDNGCTTTDAITISEPAAIVLDSAVVNGSTCPVANGDATVHISGGTTPYDYQWGANAANQTTQMATGLAPGSYNITVTDLSGCSNSYMIAVSDTNGPEFNINVTPVTCNGGNDGQIILEMTAGVSPFTYNWTPGICSNDTCNSLSADLYTVTVTDDNGCVTIDTATVSESLLLVGSLNKTDITCGGTCNGTIAVDLSGGTTPYIYNWSNGATTDSISGLCPNTYIVTVTDGNNCFFIDSAEIVQPLPLAASISSSSDASCNGFCDGEATASATGGITPYIYQWNDPNNQATQTATGLCAGTYSVSVSDQSGCDTVLTVNIGDPPVISATFTVNEPTCNTADGDITVNASGGTPFTSGAPYTYEWMDNFMIPLGQTSVTATGLPAGIYNVEVTDSTGCTDIFGIALNNATVPLVTFDAVTNVTCNGDCDGAIDISVSGNGPPFTYQWIQLGVTSEDVSSLCPGSYTVQVTDTLGCTVFADTSVAEPDSMIAGFTVTDAICGDGNGSATVTVSGGLSPYSYQWSVPETSTTASNLYSGVYQVAVSDSNGCTESFNVGVSNTDGPTVTFSSTNAACAGSCTGSASLTVTAGTSPFTYNWIPAPGSGQGTANGSNMCAGNYNVEVADANGCKEIVTIVISEPTAITDSVVISPANCGACDGQISVFASGGNAPYSYNWSNATIGNTNSNLCPGIYSVTITDNNACSNVFAYSLSAIDAPTLSTSTIAVDCHGNCNGSATVTASGGTSPYSYSWTTINGVSIGQNTATAVNLCAGEYAVQVTDNNVPACEAFAIVTITEPSEINFSTSVVNNVLCAGDCDGAVSSMAVGGILPYSYQWNDTNAQTTPTASNLCAGTYNITVTDANTCQAVQSSTIIEPAPLSLNLSVTDATCSNSPDGAVDVSVGGGTTPYSYSWSNGASSADLNAVTPDNYGITVTDDNGCTISDTAVVNAITEVVVDAIPDTTLCAQEDPLTVSGNATGTNALNFAWIDVASGDTLSTDSVVEIPPVTGANTYIFVSYDGVCQSTDTFVVSFEPLPHAEAGANETIISGNVISVGGSPAGPDGSDFVWSPSVGLEDSTIANPDAFPLQTTTYYLTVTGPSGCSAVDSVTIIVIPKIIIPGGFTPNGDGMNEVWVIDFIEQYSKATVEVYSRWGELLFQSAPGYPVPWDGKYNNKEVPVGTYYFVINLNHPDIEEPMTGPLTIMR